MISHKLLALFMFAIVIGSIVAQNDEFNDDDGDDDDNDPATHDLDFALLSMMSKRKQDAEEIRETNAKAEARRKKAYKNYEQSCEIKGKFKVRSCPPLGVCLSKQAKEKKPGRVLIEQERALNYLSFHDFDTDDETAEDDDLTPDGHEYDSSEEPLIKRLFKSKTSELAEETKERRDKAFEKYEEYCEKRKFRIGSQRNCPQIDKKKCL